MPYHKMPTKKMMPKTKAKGLTPKQKASLPMALQKAILRKMKK